MNIKQKLNKNNYFIFPVDIYHQDILFIYGDLESAVKKIKPEISSELHSQFDSIIEEIRNIEYRGVYTSRHPFRIIHLWKQPTLSEFMSVLSHEALHCTFELLDYRGIKLGSKSEEAYTHLHDYLIETIVKTVFECVSV